MSVDGFIAGPNGDMSWLAPYIGPNPAIDDLVTEIGALLVGRRTFDGDDPNAGTDVEGEAFSGAWSGPQVVVSHRAPPTSSSSTSDVTFVDSIEQGVAAARAAAGDKYVNVLGADIARQCIEAGLLDEVFVCIAPVMLGDGVRLFASTGGQNVELERISVSHAPLATNLWLRVVR
jgi:dihydrofolate reductase